MAQERPSVEASSGPVALRPIVAFDFDGTLTTHDSYTAFLKWRAGPARYVWGLIRLIPAALAYLVHRDRGRIKAAATREFLKRVPRERIAEDAEAFAAEVSAGLFRPDALAAWRGWRADGARLVIVTASPDLVVAPFARALGADALLGTQFAFDGEDRLTGGFATPNCRGAEKVVRLRAAFGADVKVQAAYGDTSGDREMLAMAETAGYQVFKEAP